MKCYQGITSCDGCKDRERGCYPGCKEKTGGYSAATGHGALITDEAKESLRKSIDASTLDSLAFLKETQSDYHLWKLYPNNGPPNCSVRYGKTRFEPRFDIFWDMPFLTPEQYERDKESWKE
ncbi:hypothetical protein ES703_118867 [subsurface metagenome]